MKQDNSKEIIEQQDTKKVTTKPKRVINPQIKSDERKFVIGVGNVIFSTWLISAYPHCYWIWHCTKLFVLLIRRYYKFSQIKWQYFLLDFCYTANYWSFLYYFIAILKSFDFPGVEILRTFFNPLGPIIFRIFFTWCVGPLALSVAIFRNSLVFHSSDQIVILAVHLSPNLAVYGIRWWTNDVEQFFPNVFHINCHANISTYTNHLFINPKPMISSLLWGSGNECSGSFLDLFYYPVLFYLILWTIPYTLFFFIFGKSKLEAGGYHTMYDSMKDTPIFKQVLTLSKSEFIKPILYMIVHFIACSFSFLLGPLLWHSFLLHTIYLLLLLYIAIKNGGSYYFQVFAERYVKNIIATTTEIESTTVAEPVTVTVTPTLPGVNMPTVTIENKIK